VGLPGLSCLARLGFDPRAGSVGLHSENQMVGSAECQHYTPSRKTVKENPHRSRESATSGGWVRGTRRGYLSITGFRGSFDFAPGMVQLRKLTRRRFFDNNDQISHFSGLPTNQQLSQLGNS